MNTIQVVQRNKTKKQKAYALVGFSVHLMLSAYSVLKLQQMCSHHIRQIQNIQERKSIEAKNRTIRVRCNWENFKFSISRKHFTRLFRMSPHCFDLLCDLIKEKIGEDNFKSEAYIKNVLSMMNVEDQGINSGNRKKRKKSCQIYNMNKKTSGGYVCGEVKVAITLRILAGASYLDVACIFAIHYNYCYQIFHFVLKNWICHDNISKYRLYEILECEYKMNEVAKQFAAGRNGGTLNGIIGALDGWVVKIKCPTKTRDGVANASGYFSRKGFYALNVQCIVDKKKRVLWRRIGARGSEHDSSAFKDSDLHNLLEEMYQNENSRLHQNIFHKNFYIIGDSAYSLRPWLITPYDNAAGSSPEDTYNYMHSACRIQVECTFGEIHSRWGIFWKPLNFPLSEHQYIIDGAFRLHNFLIDYRERQNNLDDSICEDPNMTIFESEEEDYRMENPNDVVGVFGNGSIGDAGKENRGRPTNTDATLREKAVLLRNSIRDKMHQLGLVRSVIPTV